jgi:thiol:disulfide interchange protein
MRSGAIRLSLVVAAAALPAAGAVYAARAPKLQIVSLYQLPTPLPRPYDETATPAEVMARVDAAFVRARASGKRVIVDLGANWCSWCRILSATMDLPEARPFIQSNFEVVDVDVSSGSGKTDHNLDVVHRFRLKNVSGFPWLIVAEPNGRVLASSYEVADPWHQTPQKMVNWLARWAKHPTARAAESAKSIHRNADLIAAG